MRPCGFFCACKELVEKEGDDFLEEVLAGRSVRHILISMAESLVKGTHTGVVMDSNTALIFSPSHFTWMDTNYPAATPRQGYPVEIQALWYQALCFLARIDNFHEASPWKTLAAQMQSSVKQYYFLEDRGYFSDCLHADHGCERGPGPGGRCPSSQSAVFDNAWGG